MMGLTDFTSNSNSYTAMHFQLDLTTYGNNSYGLAMPVAVPRDGSLHALSRYGFTLFYLKVPNCIAGYYYNVSSYLCD
jgi:hypothetical protein